MADPFAGLRAMGYDEVSGCSDCDAASTGNVQKLTRELIDTCSGHREPPRRGTPHEPSSLSETVRMQHYKRTGQLLCLDGSVAGSFLRLYWEQGGWKALDDAWLSSGFEPNAIIRGRVPCARKLAFTSEGWVPSSPPTWTRNSFVATMDDWILRVDNLTDSEFWLMIDLDTISVVKQLREENAALRERLREFETA